MAGSGPAALPLWRNQIEEVYMLFIFLGTALVMVIAYAMLSRTFITRMRQARRSARLARSGAEAEAVILSIERTGRYVNNEPQVKLLLQVRPQPGTSFVAEIKEVLTLMDLSRLRAGSILKVLYNPADVRELMLVKT